MIDFFQYDFSVLFWLNHESQASASAAAAEKNQGASTPSHTDFPHCPSAGHSSGQQAPKNSRKQSRKRQMALPAQAPSFPSSHNAQKSAEYRAEGTQS